MALQFPSDWRFGESPGEITVDFDSEVFSLILKIAATSSDRMDVLEEFKAAFANASGRPYNPSSSERFVEGDLDSAMGNARSNAALYLDGLWTGVEAAAAAGRLSRH
jgi:hypothetical protein